MSKRAKRLADYLESIGWEVRDTSVFYCSKCMAKRYNAKFCLECGSKVHRKKDKEPLVELEDAIAFALGSGKLEEDK